MDKEGKGVSHQKNRMSILKDMYFSGQLSESDYNLWCEVYHVQKKNQKKTVRQKCNHYKRNNHQY